MTYPEGDPRWDLPDEVDPDSRTITPQQPPTMQVVWTWPAVVAWVVLLSFVAFILWLVFG